MPDANKDSFEKKLQELAEKQNQERPKVNIDGTEIDYDAALESKLSFESANWARRLIAFLIDLILIVALWALVNISTFQKMDDFIRNVSDSMIDDPAVLEAFKKLYYQFYATLLLTWLFVVTLYHTLLPAIFGKGKTFGKLLCSLGVIRYGTSQEIQPSYLLLREGVGRAILEYTFALPFFIQIFFDFDGFTNAKVFIPSLIFTILLLIPFALSCILSIVRKDSRCLHDFLSKSVVIQADFFEEGDDLLDQEIIAEREKKSIKQNIKNKKKK